MTVLLRPGSAALETPSEPLHAEWERLAADTGADPFARPGWVEAWAATIGAPVTVATLRRDGRLVAAYPMVSGRGGVLSSAADWHVPHLDVVGSAPDRRELLAGLVSDSRRICFDFATGSTAAAIRESLGGRRVDERVREASPWIDFPAGWEAYRDSLAGRKWRELRRRRRRLDEEGDLSFDHGCDLEDLDRLLDDGFAVEGSGWKAAAGTAVQSDHRVEDFYRRVARWAADRGELQLRYMRLDGRAIAFDFALVANGAEWLLKTGFDPALSAFAPGALLRAEALEQACRAGHRYEFLGAAAPWKLEWTDRTRDVVRIEGFAPGLRGRVDRFAQRVARRLRVALSNH